MWGRFYALKSTWNVVWGCVTQNVSHWRRACGKRFCDTNVMGYMDQTRPKKGPCHAWRNLWTSSHGMIYSDVTCLEDTMRQILRPNRTALFLRTRIHVQTARGFFNIDEYDARIWECTWFRYSSGIAMLLVVASFFSSLMRQQFTAKQPAIFDQPSKTWKFRYVLWGDKSKQFPVKEVFTAIGEVLDAGRFLFVVSNKSVSYQNKQWCGWYAFFWCLINEVGLFIWFFVAV